MSIRSAVICERNVFTRDLAHAISLFHYCLSADLCRQALSFIDSAHKVGRMASGRAQEAETVTEADVKAVRINWLRYICICGLRGVKSRVDGITQCRSL